MTQVTVGENEGIESALRRFKRQVSKAGIFADLKRLRHHSGHKAVMEEALLTRGEGAAHDAAVHRLRDAVEEVLIADAKAGRLALA